MQTLRDAVVLLVVVLVLTTVRIAPLPEVRLSPAQAAGPAPTIEIDTAPVPARLDLEAIPEAPAKAPCAQMLTARKPCPKQKPATGPCDA